VHVKTHAHDGPVASFERYFRIDDSLELEGVEVHQDVEAEEAGHAETSLFGVDLQPRAGLTVLAVRAR